MKTLIVIVMANLVGIAGVRAHEHHQHASGAGLFGQPPEYVHVLLNPLPVYGSAMGVLVLGVALLSRSRPAQVAGLALLILSTASAWPVAHYGGKAYQGIQEQADEQGQKWGEEHMMRAEKLVYIFYATALFGSATLLSQRKFSKASTALSIVTLLFA